MHNFAVYLFCILATVGSVFSYCEYSVPQFDNFTSLVSTYNAFAEEQYTFPPVEFLACSTAQEFSEYIRSKIIGEVRFAVQGGRHSPGSFAYGGLNNDTPPYSVLSTRLLNNISINVSSEGDAILEIGAGVHILDVIPFLEQYTNLWFFGGSCPTVKLTGFTLSGGYTFVLRTMGMVVDYVESMDVVLWDGTVTEISSTRHKDLFWALLGGGSVGRFAFVTTFRYRLSLAPPVVTVVDYAWTWGNSNQAIPFLLLWNKLAPEMDTRCSMSLGILGGVNPRFSFRGICVSDAATARSIMTPFLSNSSIWPSATPSVALIFETDWVNATYYMDGCFTYEGCQEAAHREPWENALGDGSDGWKEDCFFGYGQLSAESWRKILDITRRMCHGNVHLCGTLLTPEGSNSRQCTHAKDTAFPFAHRCSTFHAEFLARLNTSRVAVTQAQLTRHREGIEDFERVDRDKLLLEPYAGYVDKEFCEEYEEDGEWAMMMFAQNFTHVDRLCDVRCRYDPAQLSVTPCSFDFCYCHERLKTIYE